MRRLAILLGLATLLAACSDKDTSPRQVGPKLSQRQHDSVIGASGIPGASGIRGAMRVSDSAAARRARDDSASQNP